MAVKASASITLTRVDDGAAGPAGVGISNIVNYYLASPNNTGITTSTSGWTTSVQTMTATNKYLWNYQAITYSDNSTSRTSALIIGVYGDKGPTGATGATGNGISTITEYYLVSSSNSGITTSTSGWSTTIPTMTATNKYLWNYEVIKYTNNTTSTGTPKIIGVYGDKGATGATGPAGVGIQSVDVEYYLSTSNTTQSGGSWSTTAPSWADGKYMWSRTKTVTTAGATTYSNPVCITGGKGPSGSTGATGATGKGVASIIEEYYLSTSKTTQTGGSWVTIAPTWSTGKYMWTRSKITYNNPTSTEYTTPVCDSSWEAVNEIDVANRNEWLWSNFEGIQPSRITFQYGGEVVDLPTDNPTGFKKAFHSTNTNSRLHLSWKPEYTSSGLGKKFIFSCWIKYTNVAQSTNSWNVLNMFKQNLKYKLSDGTESSTSYMTPGSFTGTSEWKKVTYEQTFSKTNAVSMLTNLWIGLESTSSGEFWVTGIQVCEGNKLGAWTPAPEDANTEYDGIYDLITDKEVTITQNYQTDLSLLEKNIQLSVSENYAEKSAVASIEQNLTSKIDQTARDVTINFNTANNETRGELESFRTEVNSYIKFDTDGMELGKSSSKFKAKLTNEKLAFLEDGSEIAYISNKEMNITDANITNQLTIGKFAFVPRSNGNTSLKWIG